MDYVFMTDEQRAAAVFCEYMNRPPPPPKVQQCYVAIPPGPDFYVPEVDGDDKPAEIEKH